MKDVIVGIDAGTSVIKSVAFSLSGEQLAEHAIANQYDFVADGGVEQDPVRTWDDTAKTLRGLSDTLPNLKDRLAAISVTGQGDGTWLVDAANNPVCPGWLWLDGRAGDIVDAFQRGPHQRARFEQTGTGFAACQQSAHMMWMQQHAPALLEQSDCAFHCKDWLYLRLTGERVTDPSEGCFTFGDFRSREYSDEVMELLGLEKEKRLLPPMLDGVRDFHALAPEAADATGLLAGTPVILGYVDVICTALGAGLYDRHGTPGCTVVGSTGVHMRLVRGADNVVLGDACTGFTMPMPIDDVYAQMQSNLASTLNIDWILDMAIGLLASLGVEKSRKDLLPLIDRWITESDSASVLYQPYILEAGERGPIIDNKARAGFVGLNTRHGYADLVNAVIEGLALAARDCYTAMGSIPDEIRLTGGAARSGSLRQVFGNVLGTRLRTSKREEAGAAGAAMMAAVAIGAYSSMDDCVAEWVSPLLGDPEDHDPAITNRYDQLFPAYVAARESLQPVWQILAQASEKK